MESFHYTQSRYRTQRKKWEANGKLEMVTLWFATQHAWCSCWSVIFAAGVVGSQQKHWILLINKTRREVRDRFFFLFFRMSLHAFHVVVVYWGKMPFVHFHFKWWNLHETRTRAVRVDNDWFGIGSVSIQKRQWVGRMEICVCVTAKYLTKIWKLNSHLFFFWFERTCAHHRIAVFSWNARDFGFHGDDKRNKWFGNKTN